MSLVRPAVQADIPSVLRLTELWANEPSTTGHYPVNLAEDLERRLGSYFWVGEEDGQVVGFAIGNATTEGEPGWLYQVVPRGEAYLQLAQLYVHPDHRSQGIGSELVRRVLEEAESRGIHHSIVSSANQDWEPIVRFYEKQGYKRWFVRLYR